MAYRLTIKSAEFRHYLQLAQTGAQPAQGKQAAKFARPLVFVGSRFSAIFQLRHFFFGLAQHWRRLAQTGAAKGPLRQLRDKPPKGVYSLYRVAHVPGPFAELAQVDPA